MQSELFNSVPHIFLNRRKKLAKKKKRGRGRPKGSGGGKRKKNELAPKNLSDSYEFAKHIQDEVKFIVSSIAFVGKKGDDIGIKGELKKINLAKQTLTEVGKETRALGTFFRDYTSALREAKKEEAGGKKKKKKKDKKGKKGKGKKDKKRKKKKRRDDDDD